MEMLPTKSYRICIHEGCQELPTVVAVGSVETRTGSRFKVQGLSCRGHQDEGLKAVKDKYPWVTFSQMSNPPWLKEAQDREIQVRV